MKIPTVHELAASELKRRKLEVVKAVLQVPQSLLDSLTRQQLWAVTAKERTRAWCCTRRAGKTYALLVALIIAAIVHPASKAIYLSTSIKRAVSTCWSELAQMLRTHGIEFTPNESRHFVTLTNGSTIHVSGCETRREADAWRGHAKVSMFAVDEPQDWRQELLSYTLSDVIGPGLADIGGRVIIAGTPGALTGIWYELAHSPEVGHASWSLFDNPHVKDAEQTLADTMRVRGCSKDDPSIQREFFGIWVVDEQRMVFPAALQVRSPATHLLGSVTGADVGVVDATACVRLEYTKDTVFIFAAEERRGLGGAKQRAFIEAHSKGSHFTVIDPGGGGAALIEDFRADGLTNYLAAEKTEKDAALRRLRDAIATGRVVAVQKFAELEAALIRLEWNPDGTGVLGHTPDIVDALLYAFRWAEKFALTAPEPSKTEKTPEELELEALVDEQDALKREAAWH